ATCTTLLCLRVSTAVPGATRRRLRCSERRRAPPSTGAASRHSNASCYASSRGRALSPCGSQQPPPRLRGRGDCDPAACFLFEDHAYLFTGQLEDRGDFIADLDRERFAKVAFVSESVEIQLERLRLYAQVLRPVLDRRDIEVRLTGDGAYGRELIACHLDVGHPRIGERFQPGVVIRAGVAERDEVA